jgi:rSAM/selenodomain-associated transferase 1
VTAILVLAKAPVVGRVKTRLCPPLTLREAATVARAALLDTLDAATGVVGAEVICVLDGKPGPWLPSGVGVVPQVGGDHASRIEAAFAGVGGPAVLIGMDTPHVTTRQLTHAIRALASNDAVLGHAEDGGWWIAGLRRYVRNAFAGVPMSTATTGDAQRARFAVLGLHTIELEPLRDVDTFDDALAVAAEAPGTRFARLLAELPSTRAAA